RPCAGAGVARTGGGTDPGPRAGAATGLARHPEPGRPAGTARGRARLQRACARTRCAARPRLSRARAPRFATVLNGARTSVSYAARSTYVAETGTQSIA